MNVKNIFRFLFPECQVIEEVKEYGFIAKKARQITAGAVVTASASKHRKIPQVATASSTPQVVAGSSARPVARVTQNLSDNATQVRDSMAGGVRNAVDSDFDSVRFELSRYIVGQKKCLDDLVVAFKRPLIAGYDPGKPKNTVFLVGPSGSGRHTVIRYIAKLLKKKGLLAYETISRLDLALYPAVAQQDLFLSDLYKALLADSEIIVFDNMESCHGNMRDVLIHLIVEGRHQLGARYSLQEDNLVESTGTLMRDSVSELTASGKYLVFVSSGAEDRILDLFGPKLMASVGDIVRMDGYSDEDLERITRKLLDELRVKCKANLSFVLSYDDTLVEHCAQQHHPTTGVAAIRNYLSDEVYKALAEYKIRHSLPAETGVRLTMRDGEVVMTLENYPEQEPIALGELVPKKYVSNLDVVKKELDSIIGLSKVKQYVLDLENHYKMQKAREDAGYKVASVSRHMIFTGNPGTGKTTIARIVAKYLKAVGALSVGQIREVSRSDLVGQYVGHTAKLTTEVIRSALGGVLFIDEAYSLCRDKHDTFGLEAIDALVKAIEDYRDDLVVILAGYRDEMEDFLKTNTGLRSRFPNIIDFEDYTAEEMVAIAKITAKSKGYRINEECFEPLQRVFEKSQVKGRNDGGNGRLVRNVIESAILEQGKRLAQGTDGELDLLQRQDFRFEDLQDFDLEMALNGIVGLENVKEFVRTQYKLLVAAEKRKKAGISVDTTQSLNMLFIGNPGTGKTTVARVMAGMFKGMGLLKKGHLIETSRGGLVAEYAGQTSRKTEEVFRNALGGVLFIDEAYSLASDAGSFGKEAIDTLVKLIEDYRGEIVVILAGYRKEMADFMKSNSGLESRFPLKIEFLDYTAAELYKLALRMISAKGFRLSKDAEPVLMEQINAAHKMATTHSGNGRMVRNLIEKTMRNQSARIASTEVEVDELTLIVPIDIEAENAGREEYDLESALSKVIGLDEVKSYVRSLYARLRLQSERKKMGLPVDSSQTLHMIFKGNPGTGKTMVARMIADILHNIGIIRTNKLVETDRAGLVAGYVGQTAIKTSEKIAEAMDGVLFVDEAYSLASGSSNDFGREAIDTLVKLMDDNRERLVVILAGYSRNMDDFLQTNPGLKSRFPNIIEFADYSLEDLMKIADGFYRSKGYVLSQDAKEKMALTLSQAMKQESFGNARYVRNLFERSLNNQALRLSTDMDLTREELVTVEDTDIVRV